MTFEKQLSSLMTAALLCGTFTNFSSGQQTAASAGVVSAPNGCARGFAYGSYRCSFGQVDSSSY